MSPETLHKALAAAQAALPDGYFVVVMAGPMMVPGSPPPHVCTVASSVGTAMTKQIIGGMARTLDAGGGQWLSGGPET